MKSLLIACLLLIASGAAAQPTSKPATPTTQAVNPWRDKQKALYERVPWAPTPKQAPSAPPARKQIPPPKSPPKGTK
jgi:hypothetical protein